MRASERLSLLTDEQVAALRAGMPSVEVRRQRAAALAAGPTPQEAAMMPPEPRIGGKIALFPEPAQEQAADWQRLGRTLKAFGQGVMTPPEVTRMPPAGPRDFSGASLKPKVPASVRLGMAVHGGEPMPPTWAQERAGTGERIAKTAGQMASALGTAVPDIALALGKGAASDLGLVKPEQPSTYPGSATVGEVGNVLAGMAPFIPEWFAYQEKLKDSSLTEGERDRLSEQFWYEKAPTALLATALGPKMLMQTGKGIMRGLGPKEIAELRGPEGRIAEAWRPPLDPAVEAAKAKIEAEVAAQAPRVREPIIEYPEPGGRPLADRVAADMAFIRSNSHRIESGDADIVDAINRVGNKTRLEYPDPDLFRAAMRETVESYDIDAEKITVQDIVNRIAEQPPEVAASAQRLRDFWASLGKETTLGSLGGPLGEFPIIDMVKVGAHYFAKGARTIGSWSKQMVDALGEWIVPHLKSLWDRVREMKIEPMAPPPMAEKPAPMSPQIPAAPAPPPAALPDSGAMTGQEALRGVEQMLARGRALAEQQTGPPTLPGSIVTRAGRRVRSVMISEYSILGSAEKAVYAAHQATRPKLGLDKKFELIAGAEGAAEADLIDFRNRVVNPVRGEFDTFEKYLALKRIQDRVREGQTVEEIQRKRVGKYSAQSASEALDILQQEVGGPAWARLEQAGAAYQEIMDRTLRLMVASGRMSEAVYEGIKRSNEFYAPFKNMAKAQLEEMDRAAQGIGKRRRIPGREELTKAITGIDDPEYPIGPIIQESAKIVARARILAAKNAKMLELDKLADVDTDGIAVKRLEESRHVTKNGPVTGPEPAPPGWDVANYLKDGAPVRMAVLPEIARALEGLNRGETELMSKMLRLPASIMRAGATSMNVGFQAANLMADVPELAFISKYGIRNPIDALAFPFELVWSFMESAYNNVLVPSSGYRLKPSEMYTEWLRSGAANSTISRALNPEAFRREMAIPARGFAERLARSPHFIKGATLDTVSRVANAVEETAKLTGFRRGVRLEGIANLEGEARAAKLEEIASEVRRYAGSPDFLRKGEAVARGGVSLNLIFMFFNARLQGVVRDLARLSGATGARPAVAAWARLAPLGIGIAKLYALNYSPQERPNYEAVPENERDRYFMVPKYNKDGSRAYFVNDEGQRVADYTKFPKREIIQLWANLIESGIRFNADRDPEAIRKWAIDFVENISPINISGIGLEQRAESVVGSMNPAIKAPIEYGTGRSTYYHGPTEPRSLEGVDPAERFTSATPELYKAMAQSKMGRALGIAPMRLEQFVGSMTGGGLNQFTPRTPAQGRSAWTESAIGRRFARSTRVNYDRLFSEYRSGEGAKKTLDRKLKNGDRTGADAYRAENKNRLLAYYQLGPLVDAITADLKSHRQNLKLPPGQKIEPGIQWSERIDAALKRLKASRAGTPEAPTRRKASERLQEATP